MLDWHEFTLTCLGLIWRAESEIIRFSKDPIAFIGLITLFGGIILTYNGLKEIIFGRSKIFQEILDLKRGGK